MNKLQKIIKTAFLVLVWFCIGLCLEITGPTLIDIKSRIEADYEEVAVALSGRFVGYFIGSVIGGVLVDKLGSFCDLIIGGCLTGLAATTVCVPFSQAVPLLWAIIMLQGTFDGIINIVGLKLILKIWGKNATSPLHILQGGFGIGSFIIPLIANPFLAIPKPPRTSQNVSSLNSSTDSYENMSILILEPNEENSSQINLANTTSIRSDSSEYITESRIEIPYFIAALTTLTLSSVFFMYHARGRRKHKALSRSNIKGVDEVQNSNSNKQGFEGFKNMVNPATCSGGRFLYGVEMFGLLFIYFANIVGGESIVGKFVRVYSIEQLGFSVSEGTYINTVYWISFSAGRIFGFIAARYVPIRILFPIETCGALISTILLNIFAPTDPTAFWVLVIFTGMFIGPGYPSGIGWADHHVDLTGMAIAFLSLGGSVGGVVSLRLVGFLFETCGPRSFLYHTMGFGIASCVIATLLTIVGSQHGSRFTPNKDETGPNDRQETEMIETERMIEHGK